MEPNLERRSPTKSEKSDMKSGSSMLSIMKGSKNLSAVPQRYERVKVTLAWSSESLSVKNSLHCKMKELSFHGLEPLSVSGFLALNDFFLCS